ncbi:MAG: hypothetical protein K9J85_11865 [Desulfobacteraceae bacterium]|nr:hypothetical protein [Desulfobacteraceae bacterium]
MEEKGYSLVFEGRVLPGFARRDVIERVGKRLGRSPENLKPLFRDKPVTVRKGLDKEKALSQQRVFSKMGVCCYVLPKADDKPTENQKDHFQENNGLQCPKCGNDLTKFGTSVDECPFCGIIISKYIKARKR